MIFFWSVSKVEATKSICFNKRREEPSVWGKRETDWYSITDTLHSGLRQYDIDAFNSYTFSSRVLYCYASIYKSFDPLRAFRVYDVNEDMSAFNKASHYDSVLKYELTSNQPSDIPWGYWLRLHIPRHPYRRKKPGSYLGLQINLGPVLLSFSKVSFALSHSFSFIPFQRYLTQRKKKNQINKREKTGDATEVLSLDSNQLSLNNENDFPQ